MFCLSNAVVKKKKVMGSSSKFNSGAAVGKPTDLINSQVGLTIYFAFEIAVKD